MDTPRRNFLKNILATGGALMLGTAMLPSMADWPDLAFQAKTTDEALMALFEGKEIKDSNKITLDVPETAENGAVVPVEISTSLENVESITIIAENNPIPLVSQFNFTENSVPWLKTRIKMAKKSDLIVIVKTQNGNLYSTRKLVTVAKGGCAS